MLDLLNALYVITPIITYWEEIAFRAHRMRHSHQEHVTSVRWTALHAQSASQLTSSTTQTVIATHVQQP